MIKILIILKIFKKSKKKRVIRNNKKFIIKFDNLQNKIILINIT